MLILASKMSLKFHIKIISLLKVVFYWILRDNMHFFLGIDQFKKKRFSSIFMKNEGFRP